MPKKCKDFNSRCIVININTTLMYKTLEKIIEAYHDMDDLGDSIELSEKMFNLALECKRQVDTYGSDSNALS